MKYRYNSINYNIFQFNTLVCIFKKGYGIKLPWLRHSTVYVVYTLMTPVFLHFTAIKRVFLH